MTPDMMIVIFIVVAVIFGVAMIRQKIKDAAADKECKNFHDELEKLRDEGKIK